MTQHVNRWPSSSTNRCDEEIDSVPKDYDDSNPWVLKAPHEKEYQYFYQRRRTERIRVSRPGKA